MASITREFEAFRKASHMTSIAGECEALIKGFYIANIICKFEACSLNKYLRFNLYLAVICIRYWNQGRRQLLTTVGGGA